MKNITIPVSGLTRATMIHQYGAEPIRLNNNDVRRKQLMHVNPTDRHLERKQYVLNTSVTLSVHRHEYDHMIGRLPEIGFFLHEQDKHNMSQFVWSRVTAKLPALDAIKDYYLLQGISEDDHDIETAERQWKRWRKKKQKERNTNTPESEPRLCCVLFSERQAKELLSRLLNLITEGCIQMDRRYLPSIEAWVYADLTPMTFQQVGDKLGRSRGNVGTSVRRLRKYMMYNNDLRILAAYCVKTTKAQPTPSAAS